MRPHVLVLIIESGQESNDVILLTVHGEVLGGSTITLDEASVRKDKKIVFKFLPKTYELS